MQNQMNISQALKFAVASFEEAQIPSSHLDARVLLEAATGKTRAQIIAYDDYVLSADEQQYFENLTAMRSKRVPVSQVLGSKEFYGRDFVVDGNVLTPRPETELMIDASKELYAADSKLKILDLGLGSGCILLTLLLEFPNASGIGADISKKAIAIAEKNKYILGVEGAELICSDWLEMLENGINFDLIVSNPPYISISDKKSLAPELGFEPETALYAGIDGLDCYRELAASLNKVNFEHLVLEIGMNQETEIIEIFEKQKLQFLKYHKDLNGIIRTLVFSNNK